MNILMALSQLEVTGAEVYATTVGNELTQRGHNVFYVSDTLTKPHDGPFSNCALTSAVFRAVSGTWPIWFTLSKSTISRWCTPTPAPQAGVVMLPVS